MKRPTFDFPLGIRPWPKELRQRGRRIREGFDYSQLEESRDSFRVSAMVGAGKIIPLMTELAEVCLGGEGFLILEFYQEEWGKDRQEPPLPAVYYSPYLTPAEIFDQLETYWLRLIHDGFVGFGLANNRLGTEIFYSEEKTLTCFTGNHLRVMQLLSRHGLRYDQQLLYPGDFGHDHLSLQCHRCHQLPAELARLDQRELDYTVYCGELVDRLDMYPVEETLSFFLSGKEQDQIEACLKQHPEFSTLAEEDFGALILDWNDFVQECETRFEGDLWEYQQGLKLRDAIAGVIAGVQPPLQGKLRDILADPDQRFLQVLSDRRKRLDLPGDSGRHDDHFWYQGIVRNQGVPLRRDLIRHGWFRS